MSNEEAQVGAIAKEAINLVTQGMGQQKKTEEKAEKAAGKAVSSSPKVKDAREKLEHAIGDTAKSAVDKAKEYAKDYTIKFRKKQPPSKEAPGKENVTEQPVGGKDVTVKAGTGKGFEQGLRHDTGIAGQEMQQAKVPGMNGQDLGKTLNSTAHKAAEAGKEAVQKAAGAAVKGAEAAGKTAVVAAAAPVAPVVAGAKIAAVGAKAATAGVKAITGAAAPVSLRSVGSKAMENLIKGNGQGNKEPGPVISAKDVGKEIVKNALTK